MGRSEPRNLRAQAFELRAKGATYALIEKRLSIPYLRARELGKAYDAQHGKPEQIIRTLPAEAPDGGIVSIPVRDLRNDSAAILRRVEGGQRFVITVSGRPVAKLGPVAARAMFVPSSIIERLIHEAALDPKFPADIQAAVGQRIDRL